MWLVTKDLRLQCCKCQVGKILNYFITLNPLITEIIMLKQISWNCFFGGKLLILNNKETKRFFKIFFDYKGSFFVLFRDLGWKLNKNVNSDHKALQMGTKVRQSKCKQFPQKWKFKNNEVFSNCCLSHFGNNNIGCWKKQPCKSKTLKMQKSKFIS